MTKVINALEARNNLGALIDEVSTRNARFVIKKRNHRSVVVISTQEYLKTIGKLPNSVRRLQDSAIHSGANKLTLRQINRIIKETRRDLQSHS